MSIFSLEHSDNYRIKELVSRTGKEGNHNEGNQSPIRCSGLYTSGQVCVI